MKVALYQEGDFYCAADAIKVFSTLDTAKTNIPKGYILKNTTAKVYAEKKAKSNKNLDRWVTIDEYQVIE